NPQALKYFQEKLKKLGVEKALRKKGISEGDIVRIGKKDFYFFA
ncbi:MAG: Obg family GTPase CgtA, partial [Candidatus Caldatribacteriota bacterium]